MTARSMQKVLTDFAGSYFAQCVPEDVDLVYDIATVVMAQHDDEDDCISFQPMVRLNVWVQYPPGPGGEKVASIATSNHLPYWMVQDGDTAPLASALESMWENILFLVGLGPVLPDLQAVLAEMDPEALLEESEEEIMPEGDDDDGDGDIPAEV